MVSSENVDLHNAQRSSFLLDAPYKWTFSDAASEHTITLPEIEGKKTYADAQHRQLRGMQWLLQRGLPSTVRWYILIDDDTWVHLPVLLRLLSSLETRFEPTRERIILGNRWHSGVFNGGAGIVLSSAGFAAIAESLYGAQCPFVLTWCLLLGPPAADSELKRGMGCSKSTKSSRSCELLRRGMLVLSWPRRSRKGPIY